MEGSWRHRPALAPSEVSQTGVSLVDPRNMHIHIFIYVYMCAYMACGNLRF